MEMPLLAALRAAEAEAAAEEAQADQEEKKKEERKEAGDTSLLALAEGEVAAAAEDAADSTAVAHAEQLRLRRFLSAAGPALARAATTALRQAQRDAVGREIRHSAFSFSFSFLLRLPLLLFPLSCLLSP